MLTTFLLGASMVAGQAPPAPLPATPQTTPPAVTAPAVPTTPAIPTTSVPYVYPEGTFTAVPAEEAAPEPTKYLVQSVLEETFLGPWMKNRNISIYGWTELSYTGSSANNSNLPYAMNDRANHFQMNQNYLHIDRAIDTSKKEFQLGWTGEFILPGTDARYTIVRGLFSDQLRNGPNGGPRQYPIDPFQIYAEAFLPNVGPNGTSVKVGRFATHCEYEMVQAPLTPFLARSYLFQYNPFTHTGFNATTQLNDDWTMSNGLVTGNDVFFDQNSNRLTYIGQLKWSPKDGNDTVLLNTTITDPSFDQQANFAFYNVYNVQWTHKFNDALTYQLDAAYSHMSNVPNVGATNWFGVVNYLFWKHSDQFTSNFRAELFEDTDGVRTGSKGLYQEYTYGLTWTPANWLIVRPFARFDYNSDSAPFEGKKDLYTGGIDVIVRW